MKTVQIQIGEPKPRAVTKVWKFDIDKAIKPPEQLSIIKEFNNLIDHNLPISSRREYSAVHQTIQEKIRGYNRQDKLKHRDVPDELRLTRSAVVKRLVESELLCYYCKKSLEVIYSNVLEKRQWTIDRIDNTRGHSLDNFHISCLECNVNRRRRSDKKYLDGKQMILKKC